MSKHTPGKLTTLPVSRDEVQLCAEPQSGKYVMQVALARVGSWDGEPPIEQVAANAERLAACWNACERINPEAVPELLAALKRIMKHYGFIEGGPDFPDAWAAIRKAEGARS